jgi:hypothetical protein
MSSTTVTTEHEHPHDHSHDDSHSHDQPAENYSARTHPEFVVMDVGAGVGGLIVHTDPELHGQEIHISPTDDDAQRSHKDVLERNINGRPAFTAVFDGIPAGSYTLWNHAGDPRERDVVISSGKILELDWRASN